MLTAEASMQGHCENYNGWGLTTTNRQLIMHEMEYDSLVQYTHITQTEVQSNPDPATITLPDTFKEAMESNTRIHGSKQWIKKWTD